MEVYVETTVWSFAFADDAPDYRSETLRFFDRCREGAIRPVISSIVLREIGRARPERRGLLERLVREIRPVLVPVSERAVALAEAFVASQAVPPSKPDDARHVAVAFAESVPVLVSWNFKHITNLRRADRFNAVAVMEGFAHTLRIASPAEVIYGF
jgi:predicted nucleic acid-binding protein